MIFNTQVEQEQDSFLKKLTSKLASCTQVYFKIPLGVAYSIRALQIKRYLIRFRLTWTNVHLLVRLTPTDKCLREDLLWESKKKTKKGRGGALEFFFFVLLVRFPVFHARAVRRVTGRRTLQNVPWQSDITWHLSSLWRKQGIKKRQRKGQKKQRCLAWRRNEKKNTA